MTKFAQMQWWFRSRESGRLNAVGYWLLAPVCAVPLYLAISFALQTISLARSASDEADWITGRHPRALNLAAIGSGASFPDRRNRLIENIRYNNNLGVNPPLISAKSLRDSGSKSGQAADLFGKAEIHVFPACVTYSPDPLGNSSPKAPVARSAAGKGAPRTGTDLSAEERLVFGRFAEFITKAFQDQPSTADDRDHSERRLARALGLSDTNATGEPLDVPWIYVASKEGAIAVFPGTDVISEHFDPASRPWFMATFLAKSQLSSDVPEANDRLTVTYLDVLAESSILVRTYLHKFPMNNQEFVVGIDLHRRGESLSSSSPALSIDSSLATVSWTAKAGAALVFSLAILAILRWMSRAEKRCFCFKLLENSIYGIVEAKDKGQALRESGQGEKITLAANGGEYVQGKFERSWNQEQSIKRETSAEASRPLRRGQEYWSVRYNTKISWHLFRLRFESIAGASLGRIQLVYTSAILPEAGWDPFNAGPFSVGVAKRYRQTLPELLRRNADGADEGYLEVPEDADPLIPLGLPKVPAWVAQAVPNPQELLALPQRRAYVSINTSTLQDMYTNADLVRAVVLQSYFERILEQGKTEFMLKGKIVHRLISFPDPHTHLSLTERSRTVYREFLDGFGTPSRVLRRVDSPMTIEGTLVPVYDFAIIKDCDGERVFVAHTVSEISLIDIASPKRTSQGYRVDGYLSWRTSDVRFYSDLFDRLAQRSKEISLDDDGANADLDMALGDTSGSLSVGSRRT